jgi:hypothetical protein
MHHASFQKRLSTSLDSPPNPPCTLASRLSELAGTARRSTIVGPIALALALLGCETGGDSKRLDYPPTDDGLKTLLTSHFAGTSAKPAEVVAAMKPDAADYGVVFEGDAATKVQAHTEKSFASPPAELGKQGDSIQVFSVTLDDLKSGSEAAEHCPGGYKRIVEMLKPDVKLYCTKVGSMSFDVFSHVNGHWVWFPKPFRALRE